MTLFFLLSLGDGAGGASSGVGWDAARVAPVAAFWEGAGAGGLGFRSGGEDFWAGAGEEDFWARESEADFRDGAGREDF